MVYNIYAKTVYQNTDIHVHKHTHLTGGYGGEGCVCVCVCVWGGGLPCIEM